MGPSPGNLQGVLEVARVEGLGGELEVTSPTAPDRPFMVTEKSPGLPIQKDSIAVDPYTATVTERIGWGDYPFLAQLRELGVQVHTGTLLGLANQILLALLMVGTIVLIILGYRMWWKRSPYRGKLPPVPTPALRELTGSVGVPVVLVTVVLAWLMPAFAVSLVAFVVVDLVINAVRQRRERVHRTIAAGTLLVAGSLLSAVALANTSTPVSQDQVNQDVNKDNALGIQLGQGTPGGGVSPEDGRVPGAVIGQPPSTDQAAPNGAPGAGTAPPTSRDSVAVPNARSGAPAGIAGGQAGGSASTTPADSAGAGRTPAAGSGANGSEDRSTGGGSGSDAPAGSSTSGGGSSRSGSGSGGPGDSSAPGGSGDSGGESSGSGGVGGVGGPADDGAEAQPPPVEGPVDDSTGIVDDLVGTLTDVARPVTSRLFSVVDSLTGELLGG